MASPIRIESIDDPRVAVFRNVRDADLRGRDDLFMAESEGVLRRLLRQPRRVHALLLSPGKYERLRPAVDALPATVPVYLAPLELMSAIAGFHIHRGALAAGTRPTAAELTLDAALGHWRDRAPCRLVLAEGLTNVDNMGALFRNAAAFGFDGVALDPTCCDPLYRKAIRVSMGHALAVPYALATPWPDELRRLKDQWRLPLVAAEIHAAARPLHELGAMLRELGGTADRVGVLVGSEGHGLSVAALANCDGVVQIPLAAHARADAPSLNVAVAAAVVMYEVVRARRDR